MTQEPRPTPVKNERALLEKVRLIEILTIVVLHWCTHMCILMQYLAPSNILLLRILVSPNPILIDIHATMWKFHDFSITQILCEINFGDCRSAKSTILQHLEH